MKIYCANSATHVNQPFAQHSQTFRVGVGRGNIVEVICILFMRQAEK